MYSLISLRSKHRCKERKNIVSLDWIFGEYSKSKSLAFFKPIDGPRV